MAKAFIASVNNKTTCVASVIFVPPMLPDMSSRMTISLFALLMTLFLMKSFPSERPAPMVQSAPSSMSPERRPYSS